MRAAGRRTGLLSALPVVAALTVASCFLDSGPSTLVVHNRTTVPIAFTELGSTNGVAACSSVRFVWSGPGWSPSEPGDPGVDRTLNGVRVELYSTPAADAAGDLVRVVTSDGIDAPLADIVGELPPCAGQPVPAPTLEVSPPKPTLTPAAT